MVRNMEEDCHSLHRFGVAARCKAMSTTPAFSSSVLRRSIFDSRSASASSELLNPSILCGYCLYVLGREAYGVGSNKIALDSQCKIAFNRCSSNFKFHKATD